MEEKSSVLVVIVGLSLGFNSNELASAVEGRSDGKKVESFSAVKAGFNVRDTVLVVDSGLEMLDAISLVNSCIGSVDENSTFESRVKIGGEVVAIDSCVEIVGTVCVIDSVNAGVDVGFCARELATVVVDMLELDSVNVTDNNVCVLVPWSGVLESLDSCKDAESLLPGKMSTVRLMFADSAVGVP